MVFEDCGNCIAMEQSGYIIYIVSKRTVWEAKIMKKITSAYANKMLRSLEEDKAFWVNKEAASSTYVAAVNQEMSIDSILIRMAQLNKRKAVLDDMRKRLPKMRVYSNSFSSSGSVPEYKYINYDLEVIRQEYDRISNTIMEMQIALDRYNQTVLFDVDI